MAEHTKDFERAVQFFRRACDLSPDYALAWDRLAACLVRQKQYEAAVKAYEQVVRITPKSVDGWYRLGECHWRLGEFDAMIAAFQKVLSLDPTISGAWSFVGHGYGSKGDDAKALEIFEESVKRARPDPGLWEDLAAAYNKVGRREDAQSATDRAKTLRSHKTDAEPQTVLRAVGENVSRFVTSYISSRNTLDAHSEISHFGPKVIYEDRDSIQRPVVLTAIEARRAKWPKRQYRLTRIKSCVRDPVQNLTTVEALIEASNDGAWKTTDETVNITLMLSEENDRLAIVAIREH